MLSLQQSVVQEVHFSPLKKYDIQLFIKRDDLIHAEVSGNKWRKLKYNIAYAQEAKLNGILTFGGAFSNHLVATAAACQMEGLKSFGIVRGEELHASSNETLKRCQDYGMELLFVSRAKYAERYERPYLEEFKAQFPGFHIVPEGGANYYGMIGCQEILNETENNYDIIVVAQGTTTTSCGILMGLNERTRLWVFPALKGYDSEGEMRQLMRNATLEGEWINELMGQVDVFSDFHFGGYAQVTDELMDFIAHFYKETKVPLDPVYTAKAMCGLVKAVEDGNIRDKRILFIHTGGLQGAQSIFEKQKRKIF